MPSSVASVVACRPHPRRHFERSRPTFFRHVRSCERVGRVAQPFYIGRFLTLSFSIGCPILAGLILARVGLSLSYFSSAQAGGGWVWCAATLVVSKGAGFELSAVSSSLRRVSRPLRPCNSPACFSDELEIHRRKQRCLHLITRQRQFSLAMLADSTFTVSLVTKISLCESNNLAPVCARPPWQVFLRCHKRLVCTGLRRRNSNYGYAWISATAYLNAINRRWDSMQRRARTGHGTKQNLLSLFFLYLNPTNSRPRKKISINGLTAGNRNQNSSVK